MEQRHTPGVFPADMPSLLFVSTACSPGCSCPASSFCCCESLSGARPPRWWPPSVCRASTWVSTTPAMSSPDIWRPQFGSPPWSLWTAYARPGASGSPRPEIPFRTLRRQMDELLGLRLGTRRFILQKFREHGHGVAIALHDDRADDFSVKIQGQSRQRFFRSNAEGLNVMVALLADLQLQLLRLDAQLAGVSRAYPVDVVEQHDVRLEIL